MQYLFSINLEVKNDLVRLIQIMRQFDQKPALQKFVLQFIIYV